MKKFLCITALALLLGLLTGCSQEAKSEQPATEETEATMDIYQKSNPDEDDVMNILMIGNSGCYYYVEELYGMLESVGIKANVCNVYYDGCKLSQHWTWWKSGEAKYDYYMTNENGRIKPKDDKVNLEWCLQQQNWDFISLQEGGFAALRAVATVDVIQERDLYLKELYGYLREQFPQSKLFWHQASAYQIGYSRTFTISSIEDQRKDTKVHKDFAIAVSERYGVDWIPRGEAAMLVREAGYDNLCARLGKGENHEGDYYHDGDWGGGQLLTASVWFEILTGQSCIGNTYRPLYTHGTQEFTLDEELVTLLQNCAHEAVASIV